ncbi:MAG: hypothetical protein II297_09605, partial [Clostridia bacterium]|nr:hypothetical protein [Clostridia bacterium]
PCANPTVPDLLVSLDGGGGRLHADSREDGGGRLWAKIVRSPHAAKVAAVGGGRSYTDRHEIIKNDGV